MDKHSGYDTFVDDERQHSLSQKSIELPNPIFSRCKVNTVLIVQIVQTLLLVGILGCFIFLAVIGWDVYVYVSTFDINLPNEQLLCFVVKILGKGCPVTT